MPVTILQNELNAKSASTGDFIGINAITGESGVYVGSEAPTNPKVKVWVDTSGDSDPEISKVTASVDNVVGTPSVDVTLGGSPASRTIDFAFHNLKGNPGEASQEAVDNWLNEHPEATTTVQDGSLTESKFSDALKLKAIKDYVTPEMFGAKGDGVTDDSDALNAMLASSNKYIFIPPKTYYCAKNIALGVNDKNIVGSGRYCSIFKLANDCSFTANASRVTISDLQFSGGEGVVCNAYHVSWLNCLFTKSTTGIALNNGYINQFASCYFVENQLGILLNNQSYETVFQSCVIDNNVVGVIVCGGSTACIFNDCTIEGNSDRASHIGCGFLICATNCRVIISGCFFEMNGSEGNSADIIGQNYSAAQWATNLDDVYGVINSVYSGDKYYIAGKIVIENNRFYGTKYGVITGGNKANYSIRDNYFMGVLDKYNVSVLINGDNLMNNVIDLTRNIVLNTQNSTITTQMLTGIKGSYVYTDIVPYDSQYDALIKGQVFLDGDPIFLYRGKFSDFTGTKVYPKIKSSDGESHDWGLVNNNITNCYTGSTATLFVSPDGSDNNMFSAANTPLTFIVVSNNSSARANTVELGWRSFDKKGNGIFPINRYSIQSRYLLAYNNTMVYAFIELSADDIAKTKQCLAFEPTDLTIYEFRN